MKTIIAIACLIAASVLAAEPPYRIDIARSPYGNGSITTYTVFDRDVKSVTGVIVLSNEVHVSTQFEVFYKDEVVARTEYVPDRPTPRVTMIKNARQGTAEYRGAKFVWLRLWDGVTRRVSLPGEGPYVIDADAHIRVPKPEEMIAIWKAEREHLTSDERSR